MPDLFFFARMLFERGVRGLQLRLELLAVGCRALEIFTHPLDGRAAFATFLFRALASRDRVALALFSDGNLGAQLLRALPLLVDEARELAPARFGRSAC